MRPPRAAARVVLCGLVLLAAVREGAAADIGQPEPAGSDGWTFAVAPYFWMAGIKGTVEQFGAPAVDVDESFLDIIENFDIGAMSVAEARYGAYGVAFDLQYAKISAHADTRRGLLADRIEVTSQTFTGLAAGEYRVWDSPQATVDLMAGARIWSVETDIDPQGGLADAQYFSDGDTWVDPVVGARARIGISESFYATGWGMIGGFGAGSDITWDVMAAIGYEVTDRVSIVGGYRALGVDYRDGDFVFDVVQQGPILGTRISF